MAASIVAKALNFLFFMFAARYLGTDDFGVLSYAIALSGIFAVIYEIGLDVFIAREVARNRDLTGKYISNLLGLRFLTSALFFVSIFVFLVITRQPGITRAAVYLMAISMILNHFTLMFFAALRAHEMVGYEAFYNALSSAFLFLGGFFIIARGSGVLGFSAVFVLTSFVFLIYALLAYKRQFSWFKPEIDRDFIWRSLKEAWPMGVMAIFIMIYFRTDVVMLSLMKGDAAVGIYGVSYRLSEAITMIPSMLLYALFPVASRYHEESKPRFENLYSTALQFLLILAFPIGLSITLLARQLITALFSNEYSESAACLQVLIWAAAVMFMTMVLGNALVAANKQRFTMYFAMISAVLNIGLNALLIPRYSYIGASIATLVTESVGVIFGLAILHRFGYRMNLKNVFGVPVIAMAVSILTMSILLYIDVNIYITAAASLISYLVFVAFVGMRGNYRDVIWQTIRSLRPGGKE